MAAAPLAHSGRLPLEELNDRPLVEGSPAVELGEAARSTTWRAARPLRPHTAPMRQGRAAGAVPAWTARIGGAGAVWQGGVQAPAAAVGFRRA